MVQLEPSFTVRRYQPDDFAQWESFVERSADGTFMQSRTFLQYHPEGRFEDHSLVIMDHRGKWRAVFPAAAVAKEGSRVLHSHPGATYGGLMLPEDTVSDKIDGIVNALVVYARESDFNGIRMRTPERIFRRRSFDELDVAYFRAGFQIEGRELSSAFRLTGDTQHELMDRFRAPGRRHVRAAERAGVTSRLSDDLETYWKILSETLAARHDARPTHTLDEIRILQKLLPDRIRLVAGYLGEQMISGTVLFLFNPTAAHTFYIAQDYRYSEYHSLSLVLLTAAEYCRQQGFQWLNYGISSLPGSRGLDLNHGLYGFKRGCGGEGVTRDMWFLPLTTHQ